jgi:hypothetical protein
MIQELKQIQVLTIYRKENNFPGVPKDHDRPWRVRAIS